MIRRGDDDGVDVLVVHDPPQVLDEPRLERGDILEPRVVDAFGRQVRVHVAEGLDLDVRELGEPALDGVPLTVDPDAGDHDLAVRAEDAAAHVRRRLEPGTEESPRRNARRTAAPAGEVAP